MNAYPDLREDVEDAQIENPKNKTDSQTQNSSGSPVM